MNYLLSAKNKKGTEDVSGYYCPDCNSTCKGGCLGDCSSYCAKYNT